MQRVAGCAGPSGTPRSRRRPCGRRRGRTRVRPCWSRHAGRRLRQHGGAGRRHRRRVRLRRQRSDRDGRDPVALVLVAAHPGLGVGPRRAAGGGSPPDAALPELPKPLESTGCTSTTAPTRIATPAALDATRVRIAARRRIRVSTCCSTARRRRSSGSPSLIASPVPRRARAGAARRVRPQPGCAPPTASGPTGPPLPRS